LNVLLVKEVGPGSSSDEVLFSLIADSSINFIEVTDLDVTVIVEIDFCEFLVEGAVGLPIEVLIGGLILDVLLVVGPPCRKCPELVF
jgi:hypothetical protein